MNTTQARLKYIESTDMRSFYMGYIDTISTYNHNYYKGLSKGIFDTTTTYDLLYGVSDDDDTTEWYIIDGTNTVYLGCSYCSEDELLHHEENT